MSEINLLDKSVYNRIAAGEVVERPSSIVKELVENSIDAGATSISIEIRGGGIESIRVADNGKGIAPEDVPTAFMAHATSKIHTADDLDSIATLGFRGEALPSIAAVSKVTMLTRRKGAAIGYRYCVDNGVVTDEGESGCPYGTVVICENLFANIPARKKFLSKETAEESAVSALVAKIILANHDVSISYSSDGKTVYRSSGQGVKSAIYTVYGDDFLKKLDEVSATFNDIEMFGYFSKPSFSKHSKSFQTVIVNGRYVISDEISYWIYGCYQEFLMKRQFPAFVMYLKVPCDMVDVNVHPNKLEVKFANQGIIKKLVTDAVKSKIIDGVRVAKELGAEDINFSGFSFTEERFNPKSDERGEEFFLPFNENDGGFKLKDESKNYNADSGVIFSDETAATIEREELKDSAANTHFSDMVGRTLFNSIADLSKTGGAANAEDAENEIIEEKPIVFGKESIQQSMGIDADIKYSGKIFNTYLIFENGNDVFFIDQHAAHERIMYDKLEKEFNSGSVAVQNLLIPYIFNVSIDEKEALESKIGDLEKCGFNITPYGENTFALRSVPTRCGELDFAGFLNTLIHDVTQRGVIDDFALFKDKIMQNACKSAIKGEDDISKEEIVKLVADIAKSDAVLFCPHGRPIVVKISKTEVEKWFKRIV